MGLVVMITNPHYWLMRRSYRSIAVLTWFFCNKPIFLKCDPRRRGSPLTGVQCGNGMGRAGPPSGPTSTSGAPALLGAVCLAVVLVSCTVVFAQAGSMFHELVDGCAAIHVSVAHKGLD